MDQIRVQELIRSETTAFRQAIKTAVNQYAARLNEFQQQLFKIVDRGTSKQISEDEFGATLDMLEQLSGNTREIMQRAGFSDQFTADWLNKKTAPPESFRGPLLRIIVSAVFDDFAEDKLRDELYKMLEEHGIEVGSDKKPSPRLPLDQKVEELAFWKEISVRSRNCIKKDGIVTLGELLVPTQAEWLRVPNFGHKSLNELDEALKKQFGVGVGQFPENERQRYEGMAQARDLLNQAAGQLLPSHWDSKELKPEYKALDFRGRADKVNNGEEIYVQITADPELLEALRLAGIIYKTQLATAPQSVIDQICHGHNDWKEQLSGILDGSRGSLSLYTKVPLHLDEKVVVYQLAEIG